MRSRLSPEAWLLAAALLATAFAPVIDPVRPAEAEASTSVAQAAFPTAYWEGSSAVWGADAGGRGAAYVFGAYGGLGDSIYSYAPSSDTLTLLNVTLPTPLYGTSAAWDGKEAFIFGGLNPSTAGFSNQVLRFRPFDSATGGPQVVAMNATLPAPESGIAAAWDGGSNIYLFGGEIYTGASTAQILRYNITTDRISVMRASLAYPTTFGSAVWDGKQFDVFGIGDGGGANRYIERYHPGNDTAVLSSVVSDPKQFAPAVVDRFGYAYLLGGQAMRYNPTNDTIALVKNPRGDTFSFQYYSSAAFDGTTAYVFGGRVGTIQRFTPNQPPVSVIAPTAPAECVAGRANVTLDGSLSYDRDNDPVASYAWSAPGVAFDDPASLTPAGSFPFGNTTVQLLVSDGDLTDTGHAIQQVVDTQPPSIALLRPQPSHVYVNDWVDAYDGQLGPLPPPLPQDASILVVGPLTVQAVASDACGVASVAFDASDGEHAAPSPQPGGTYAFHLAPPAGFAGDLQVNATVTDLGGHQASTSVHVFEVGRSVDLCHTLHLSPTVCRELPPLPTDQPIPTPPPDVKPLCLEVFDDELCSQLFGP